MECKLLSFIRKAAVAVDYKGSNNRVSTADSSSLVTSVRRVVAFDYLATACEGFYSIHFAVSKMSVITKSN